jgi:hypothetical protein
MISLDDIDFVEPAGKPHSFDPELRQKMVQEEMATWRQIFQEGVSHQICLARDPDYRKPHQQFVERDGVTQREINYVPPKPWWFEQDGEVFLRLNFGDREFVLPGKNPVIRVGKLEDLLPTLEQLHILVSMGELDEIIENMVIVSQR